MDYSSVVGPGGNEGQFPSVGVPANILPGSWVDMLRVGCINVKGCSEVKKKGVERTYVSEEEVEHVSLSEIKM